MLQNCTRGVPELVSELTIFQAMRINRVGLGLGFLARDVHLSLPHKLARPLTRRQRSECSTFLVYSHCNTSECSTLLSIAAIMAQLLKTWASAGVHRHAVRVRVVFWHVFECLVSPQPQS